MRKPSRMCARLQRALQIVLGAADDDVDAVVDVVLHQLLQVEDPRRAVHEREHDHAEGLAQLGVLEQEVQDLRRVRVAPQLDLDADAVAVGVVGDVGDAVDLLLARKLRDLLDAGVPC